MKTSLRSQRGNCIRQRSPTGAGRSPACVQSASHQLVSRSLSPTNRLVVCCKFQMQTSLSPSVCRAFLGWQVEKAVDELNLTKKIISCHPSNLPLPDHVDGFVALNRSPSRVEFSEAQLGVHSTFDGSMILFENVV